MKLPVTLSGLACCLLLLSCETSTNTSTGSSDALPVQGTWELVSGTTITKNDTLFTDYRKNQRTIKIINGTHFSFLRHDLTGGKDTSAIFVAGGGPYTLSGSHYTERLEFCSDRQWEGQSFEFELSLRGDTLIQTGVEKVEAAGVDRVITETYIRTKK